MSLGFGEIICPECYNAEEKFIFLDMSYWLNRIIVRNINRKNIRTGIDSIKNPLNDATIRTRM
jgi:hypothetical protein